MLKDNNQANIIYDRKHDVLYISFGSPRPSYCDAEIDDVFIMRDIETNEYCEFKVLGFMERLKDGSLYHLQLPFEFDLKQLETYKN